MSLSADVRERAQRSGHRWARILSDDMRRDGRALEGGFPGTRSEARLCALGVFGPSELVEPLGAEIVQILYTSARAAWNASCRSRV